VKSPVSGVVSSVDVTEGTRVAQGGKLGTIIDPSKLKIQIEVAVSDMQDISRGLVGELRLSGEEKPFAVKVIGLSPFADPGTGTASAELSLVDVKKGGTKLPPGMIGTVSFKARDHQGIEVPEDAVVYRGQDAYLRLVEKGKAKYQLVTLGQTRGGAVEILRGLEPGQTVIVRTSTYVGNGEEVTPQPLDNPNDSPNDAPRGAPEKEASPAPSTAKTTKGAKKT
jgi:RND family efflux transporter MFP subunit